MKTSGYFGDSGNKDVNKVELMGFLMSDIMCIQGAIVNGVEISITMIPNTDNIRLQSFKNNTYGRTVINDIYVMSPGSGEDPELQNTLKNASYRGGRAAN